MKRFLSGTASLALTITALVAVPAQAVGFNDGLPAQFYLDTSEDPNVGHWVDMDGGVDDRPFVTQFSVINGDTTQVIVAEGNTDREFFYNKAAGIPVITIEPYNLCPPNKTPGVDMCYATPNRVALSVGYSKGGNNAGFNFSDPTQNDGSTPQSLRDIQGNPLTVNENTVFDITLNLNTIGKALRWAMMFGHPEYWEPLNLGRDNATIHLRMRPAMSDIFTGDPVDGEMTCWKVDPSEEETPCPSDSPDATVLRANIVFSLEEGYGEDLTGAVFGVSRALNGEFCNGTYAATSDGSNPYCQKTASPQNPVMEFQMIGFHYQAGHSGDSNFLNEGTLEAFLPASMLMNTYGLLPGYVPEAFEVTRASTGNWADSAGSFDTPTFDVWDADTEGSDGVLLTVGGVTYSAPKFTVERTGTTLNVDYSVKSSIAKFQMTVDECSVVNPCQVSIYKLGAKLYDSRLKKPVIDKRVTKSSISLRTKAGVANNKSRFLVNIEDTVTGDLINSTTVKKGQQ